MFGSGVCDEGFSSRDCGFDKRTVEYVNRDAWQICLEMGFVMDSATIKLVSTIYLIAGAVRITAPLKFWEGKYATRNACMKSVSMREYYLRTQMHLLIRTIYLL